MFTCHIQWIVAAIVLCGSFAEARTWEFKKDPPVEGELIDVDGTTAIIRKPNGEIYREEQHNFQAADRKIVDQWVAAEESIPVGDKIDVTAVPYWEAIQYASEKEPSEVVLVVLLKVRGKAAAEATCYSELKLEQVVTNNGTPLTASKLAGDLNASISITRYGKIKQPTWGFREKLIWKEPELPLESIRRIAGSLKIITGTPKSVLIEHLGKTKDRLVEDPLFDKTELKVVEAPVTGAGMQYGPNDKVKQFAVHIEGPPGRVFSVELLDDKRALVNSALGGTFSASEVDKNTGKKIYRALYSFDFPQTSMSLVPTPKNPQLRVTVLDDSHEEPVTFEFADLKIPMLKSSVKHKKDR